MYYTVTKHSSHLRTLDKCRNVARVFYISLVFSNDHRVLSQCNTRLRLLYLLNIKGWFSLVHKHNISITSENTCDISVSVSRNIRRTNPLLCLILFSLAHKHKHKRINIKGTCLFSLCLCLCLCTSENSARQISGFVLLLMLMLMLTMYAYAYAYVAGVLTCLCLCYSYALMRSSHLCDKHNTSEISISISTRKKEHGTVSYCLC